VNPYRRKVQARVAVAPRRTGGVQGALVAAFIAALAVTASAVPALAGPAAPGSTSVVVTSAAGLAATADAVKAAGGEVVAELPLIGGVEARLPARSALPAGFRVTPDRPFSVASDSQNVAGPVSTVRATVGLPSQGNEGSGVTVALVDTGVADVPDLAGRVVEHIDVTGTGGGDGNGHGTFLAGLIAGNGRASNGAYLGVAPGAQLLDVKVAAQDGSTSLVWVLRGLQAVADRSAAYDVRVLNLSLSSNSPMPYQADPLNQALETLWRKGITVVTSAGNDGPDAGSIASPGNDPLLLTIGGVDEAGTSDRGDDVVAPWSARGPTAQGVSKPDLVAPGTRVIGLRSPGSAVDTTYPQARVGDHYVRGSGTSMATAVTSAAVADILAVRPQLQPNDLKALLVATAYESAGLSERMAAGSRGLDVAAALAVAPSVVPGARGDRDDALPGDPARWQALADALDAGDRAAAARAWKALDPASRSWASRSWATLDPASRSWASRSWASRSWAGADGTAEEWLSRSWASRSWASRSWASRSWAGDDWASRSWASRSWAGDDWASRSWASRSWASRSWAAAW